MEGVTEGENAGNRQFEGWDGQDRFDSKHGPHLGGGQSRADDVGGGFK